jgi:pimeloyl-ACP methyl ester carboxylesterase
MHIIDRGHGVPIVLIPGIQGRWEYMRPAIDALTESFRVITFALAGERKSRRRFDPARGLDNFVDQIDEVLDARGLTAAAICGVSFGGVVALRYAAERPARTSALMLVSTPGPDFRLAPRHRVYARAPWLFGPAFLAEIPRRVGPELKRALPDTGDRLRFSWRQVRTFFRAPMSVWRMAERSALLGSSSRRVDCARVSAPTLVIAGEPGLDYIVPPDGTADYVRLIAGARGARIDDSGHLGYVTRPSVFADIVEDFLTPGEKRRAARHNARPPRASEDDAA